MIETDRCRNKRCICQSIVQNWKPKVNTICTREIIGNNNFFMLKVLLKMNVLLTLIMTPKKCVSHWRTPFIAVLYLNCTPFRKSCTPFETWTDGSPASHRVPITRIILLLIDALYNYICGYWDLAVCLNNMRKKND